MYLWARLMEKWVKHCVKSVQIRSFFWSVFSRIRIELGLNTERYSVSLYIQSKCGKIRTRKNSVTGQFSRSEGATFRIGRLLAQRQASGDLRVKQVSSTLINISLVKLPLHIGPELAVRSLTWWSILPGGSSSRGKLYVLSYHIYGTSKNIKQMGSFLWGKLTPQDMIQKI